MTGDDQDTPARPETTTELVLRHVMELRSDVANLRAVMSRNHDLQLAMFEDLKAHEQRIARLERQVWLPSLVAVLAALMSLACVYRVLP